MRSRPRGRKPQRASIWPHVEERIVDLVEEHRSTIVFANSRRLAERLTARLNEIASERATEDELPAPGRRPPRDHGPGGRFARAARATRSPAPTTARCRKEQRARSRTRSRPAACPAVVATSSLELGIDMGAVDLVVQVESPPSVASGLQRVGRAGHQVGAVSRGVVFPKYRGDLLQTAVVVERMRERPDRGLRYPRNPARRARPADRRDRRDGRLGGRRAARRWSVAPRPSRRSPASRYDAVLDMLSGRYPSDEFAELRPRLVWDRVTGTLTGRARRAAARGDQRRHHPRPRAVRRLPGRRDGVPRVGELDEEMVYESRVGDVFTLGSTVLADRGHHPRPGAGLPAPGQPGRLPFWKGDALGRPIELGRALGAFVRELGRSRRGARSACGGRPRRVGAADNLLAYLREQREATGHVPDDRTIAGRALPRRAGRLAAVDPLAVRAPGARPVGAGHRARLRERYGVDVQAMHSDDGIVLRLPDTRRGEGRRCRAGRVRPRRGRATLVTAEVGGSALFAVALPGVRGPGLAAAPPRPGPAVAAVAAATAVGSTAVGAPASTARSRSCWRRCASACRTSSTCRGCGADARPRIASRAGRRGRDPQPSPFAPVAAVRLRRRRSCMRVTRRWPSGGPLPWRSTRLCSPSCSAGRSCASCSTRGHPANARGGAATARPTAGRGSLEDVADLLRLLGPLSTAAVERDRHAPPSSWQAARRPGAPSGSGSPARSAGPPSRMPAGCATRSACRCRSGCRRRSSSRCPIRWVTSCRATPARTARSMPLTRRALGLGVAVVVRDAAEAGGAGGSSRASSDPGASGTEWCDAEVLRLLRRRSLAALRKEVEPVDPAALAGSCRLGNTWAARSAASTVCCGSSSSSVGALCLPARWNGWSCRPGRRGTRRRWLDELCDVRRGRGRTRRPAGHRRLGVAACRRRRPVDPSRPGR